MTSLNQLFVSATSSGLTTATTSYADGDVVGAEMSWDMGSGSYGVILGAQLISKADIIGAFDLFLFDRSVTFGSDNAAPSISDADALFNIGCISFPYPFDVGGARIAHIDSLALPVKANASGLIYGRLVTRSAHTFFGAAGDLQVNLHFSLDV
ncbi:MAG: hypothetical protein KA129_01275 [Microthrixaceae bacterium]|nr:hypothetical protein [Microthrixaceae bacterium]